MELHVLHRHGWTITALAREFGLNWRTVKRELSADQPRRYGPRARPTALTPAQVAHVERRLEAWPRIRGTDLHRELRADYGYRGSYVSLGRQLRGLRPQAVTDPEIRFETAIGVQTQADWAHLGRWPLGEAVVALHAMVAVLGCSRAIAIRMATDCTRPTTFDRLAHCLADLGGVSHEILTDRDPAFCVGATKDGRAIFAAEWMDAAALLGVVPRACRPYRAKTKGKVERVIREVKESFRAWLSGQVLPLRPTLADYDDLARRWINEVILTRRHRTTGRIVAEAWAEERTRLAPIPRHVLARLTGGADQGSAPDVVVDLSARLLGEHVEVRSLAEYEAVL